MDDKKIIFGNEIIQLKTNKIPRGLVELERIFDGNNSSIMKSVLPRHDDLEEVNLGTNSSSRKVFIGNKLC